MKAGHLIVPYLILFPSSASSLKNTTAPASLQNLIIHPVYGDIGDLDLNDPIIKKLIEDPPCE